MAERLIRLSQVKARVPYSRSSIYEKIARGVFPRPRRLGPRAVAWLESDIDAWIAGLEPIASKEFAVVQEASRLVEVGNP